MLSFLLPVQSGLASAKEVGCILRWFAVKRSDIFDLSYRSARHVVFLGVNSTRDALREDCCVASPLTRVGLVFATLWSSGCVVLFRRQPKGLVISIQIVVALQRTDFMLPLIYSTGSFVFQNFCGFLSIH